MATIRRLSRPDGEVYRAIRLEALERHPEAFGASLADEASQDLDFFEGRLERSVVFGAFVESDLLGTAGYFLPAHEKARHKAVLFGVYVRAEARGTGLARKLLEAVLQSARGDAEQIGLTVVSTNERARHCFESLGFAAYGTEPRAMKVGGTYFDESLMSLSFGTGT